MGYTQAPTFCYWQIIKNIDFYIGGGLILISTILFAYILRSTILVFAHHKHIDSKVKIIFIHLSLWGFFHIAKLAFGMLVFELVFEHYDSTEKEKEALHDQVQKYSGIFCVVDSISTCFLAGVLLIVPFIWTTNIVRFLAVEQFRTNSQNSDLSQRSERKVKVSLAKSRRALKFLKAYIYARYVIYAGMFATELVFISQPETANKFCTIINYYIIIEALFCVFVLSFGLVTLWRNFRQLQLNDEKDKSKILREFVLLMLFCMVRLLVNTFFLILRQNEQDEAYTCKILRNRDGWEYTPDMETLLYFLGGVITTHFLPVILLLKLYDLDLRSQSEKKQKTSSIESHDSNNHVGTLTSTLLHGDYVS